MGEMVEVANPTKVTQVVGHWIIPPGGSTLMPLSLVPSLGPQLEVIRAPEAQKVLVYRNPCEPTCGHSLCILTRGLTAALVKQGVEVKQQPWRDGIDQAPAGATYLCNSATFQTARGAFSWPHPDADICPRRHADLLRQNWVGHICSSQAVKDSLVRAAVKPETCYVVADGIDVDLYQPAGEVASLGGDSFVFLDLGAQNPRKGFDLALEAYGRAFTAADDVVLVLKDYSYGWGREGKRWCQQLVAEWQERLGKTAPRLEYIYGTWAPEQIAAAYRRAAKHGAYLMPSRYEGFGLTALEALACGCRIGVTGWSGPLQYATPENATLFPYSLSRNEANPGFWEKGEEPRWANPDLNAMVDWMRRMVSEAPNVAQQQAISDDVRTRFGYARMAREFAEVVGLELSAGTSVTRAASTASHSKTIALDSTVAPAPPLPIPNPETLGIGIPTRDRPTYLLPLLGALYSQTKRPDALVIVNDGRREIEDDPGLRDLLERFKRAGTRVEIVAGTQRGASPNHQLAMERLKTDLVLRMDDDLMPAGPDFVERLYRLINQRPEVGAVGGVYPRSGDERVYAYAKMQARPGYTNGLVDLLQKRSANLQFERYSDEALVECEHLYSTWVYRRRYLESVGGFPDCYSRFGQREETDAAVRMHLLGGYKLLVDTAAVAWHYLAKTGGRRPEGTAERVQQDDLLFRRRLAEWQDVRARREA